MLEQTLVFKEEISPFQSRSVCEKISAKDVTPAYFYKRFFSKNQPAVIKNYFAQRDDDIVKINDGIKKWSDMRQLRQLLSTETEFRICKGNRKRLGVNETFPCELSDINQYFELLTSGVFVGKPDVEYIYSTSDYNPQRK